jgi:FMN phosphatase YigB (HAD superfamily)
LWRLAAHDDANCLAQPRCVCVVVAELFRQRTYQFAVRVAAKDFETRQTAFGEPFAVAVDGSLLRGNHVQIYIQHCPSSQHTMLKRVVAFDLGGVVVDVDKSVLRGLDDAFFTGSDHDQMSVGTIDGATFIERVARRADISSVDVEAMWRQVVHFSAGGAELIASTSKRCAVAVWSNTDPIHWSALHTQSSVLSGCTLSPSFAVGAMKPSPAFFQRARATLGDAHVLFLDDRSDNVAAARALGIDAHVVVGVDAAAAAINRFLSV